MHPLDRSNALLIIRPELVRIKSLFDTPLGSWEDKIVPFVKRNRKLHRIFPDYIGKKLIDVCIALKIDITEEDRQWLREHIDPLIPDPAGFNITLTVIISMHLRLHLFWDEVSSKLTLPKDHYFGLIHTGISGKWLKVDHTSFLQVGDYGFPLEYCSGREEDNQELTA